MKKKAFTLMELLLSIAVLAIVAASAIPTFFGGAKEAIEDARKANMHTAYQRARTGANLLIGIVTARADTLSGNLDCITEDDHNKSLNFYSPISSRIFEGKNGSKFVFGANISQDSNGKNICTMTYVSGEDPTQTGIQVAEPDATDYVVHEALNTLWETVFAAAPQQ